METVPLTLTIVSLTTYFWWFRPLILALNINLMIPGLSIWRWAYVRLLTLQQMCCE